jgi:prevent-host-death family protein
MTWQLQKAKQHLSEVLDRAIEEGPQVVTRHGREVAVILGIEEYRRLAALKPDFKRFLLEAPPFAELTIERSSDLPREVDL